MGDHVPDKDRVYPGRLPCGDDRDADTAEGDRRTVGQEANTGRVERLEAQPNEHGGRDGDRGPEAGAALQKRAQGKRDQQRL